MYDGRKITRQEAYWRLNLIEGDHFLFMNTECVIDSTPQLLINDSVLGIWRKPYYSKMQLEYVLEHPNQVYPLSEKNWTICDCDKEFITWFGRRSKIKR